MEPTYDNQLTEIDASILHNQAANSMVGRWAINNLIHANRNDAYVMQLFAVRRATLTKFAYSVVRKAIVLSRAGVKL